MLSFLTRLKVERVLISDSLFKEIARLRYQVYCEDMGFLEKEKYPQKEETDEYDGQAIHIAVLVGRHLSGYARVIFPDGRDLPVFEHFQVQPQDAKDVCEVSRFMISKMYRNKTETRRTIFTALATEIQAVAKEQRVKKIYAVVEDWLLKSLQKRGINFKKVGQGRDYMGAVTFPVMLELE